MPLDRKRIIIPSIDICLKIQLLLFQHGYKWHLGPLNGRTVLSPLTEWGHDIYLNFDLPKTMMWVGEIDKFIELRLDKHSIDVYTEYELHHFLNKTFKDEGNIQCLLR